MNLLPPSKRQRPPNASPSPVFLPDELIAEVISFLPVKYLTRLKCVSKSWKYLISESTFVKLHLHRSAKTAERTIVSYMYVLGCIALSFTALRLFNRPPIIINLPGDPYYQLKDKECNHIVGSCNGLLCLSGYSYSNGYGEMWLRFWNPASRTISEKLGGCCDDDLGFPFYSTFGYDNSTDTYKVVYFLPNSKNVRVFSLGQNVWRNIQNSPVAHHQYHHQQMNVVDLSGSVNWLDIRNYTSHRYNYKDITTVNQMDIRNYTSHR